MTLTAESGGRLVDAGGIATHYHEAGTGEPVLLLHGSGPGVSAWANWRLTIPTLSRHFRVLAPDSVGFGYTERPQDVRYSLQTWIDHVWTFMDAHGIARAAVVGNSLGGRIALGMAAQRPERVSRMVLMGAPGVGMRITEGLRALRAYEPSLESMRDLLVRYFAVDPSIITDDLVRARYEASVAPGAYEAYRAMFFDPRHAGSDLAITEEEVTGITTPTLLVHGREDKVVPVDVAWTMSQLLPTADLHVFARCGHWTQIERSAEFCDVVRSFLAAPPACPMR
ncbi:alpha/beta fold hydrolase [Streptomyces sp. RB6PN25]|uniref:Alpha/beta fold hydrolase n=1 Tax=Streptomyces humicola TaxID=2953240 RepID=A0ABT1PNH1_9ACTN|nr:alpha/beta fold hydrolase [Streptomyces humicola]MCQ4079217.1 alpha/beta fold hydrolase [Streptomyces humicola]